MKKRWTLKITLALLAGAVVTWAVAWGCAIWGSVNTPSLPFEGSADVWPEPKPGWPAPSVVEAAENTWTTVRMWSAAPIHGHYAYCSFSEGWPARALSHSAEGLPSGSVRRHAVWCSTFGAYVSTRPIPLGFTLNTLLAAAVLLTLTEGAGAWRRRARRRKGRCPWCGYDRAGVAGDAKCPECGGLA